MTSRTRVICALLAALPAWAASPALQDGAQDGASAPFAGEWRGACADGRDFVILKLNRSGAGIGGSISLGNTHGGSGWCETVLDAPSPEHAFRIGGASERGNVLDFTGPGRTGFEMTLTGAATASLRDADLPEDVRPWALRRVQPPPAGAAFEVASVKPAVSRQNGREAGQRSRIEYTPASLAMHNVTLAECIEWAYGVKPFQVTGAGVSSADRWDILARAGGPAPPARLKAMLQDLLARRFGLQFHRETKTLPVYELSAAKGGPRLPSPRDGGDASTRAQESLPRVEGGDFVFESVTMAGFAAMLSELRGIGLPVVDHTGAAGVFDIRLKSAAAAVLQPDGPSLLTLLREQLGLELVPARAAFEILAIDRAGKPTAN